MEEMTNGREIDDDNYLQTNKEFKKVSNPFRSIHHTKMIVISDPRYTLQMT